MVGPSDLLLFFWLGVELTIALMIKGNMALSSTLALLAPASKSIPGSTTTWPNPSSSPMETRSLSCLASSQVCLKATTGSSK